MNTPQVHVMAPIIEHLKKEHEVIMSARDFSETFELLRLYNIDFIPYGGHAGGSWIKKRLYAIKMFFELNKLIDDFDVNISMGSYTSPFISRLRGKPCIVLTDNEYSIAVSGIMSRVYTHYILPKCLENRVSSRVKKKAHFFNGFKENIYIHDHSFNDTIIRKIIPFQKYIILRCDNTKGHYVPKGTENLIPEIIQKAEKNGLNIVLVPRYPEEKQYADGKKNVFVLSKPVNGLDLLYYSDGVATGAGTFAREAALMGIPAVQFYPGENASVDKELIKQKKMYYTRNSIEIINYLLNTKRKKINIEQSFGARESVIEILESIINRKE